MVSKRSNLENEQGFPPVATLFIGGGAAAVLVAVANVVWLAQSFGLGRLRELGLFWGLRRLFVYAGLDFNEFLPAIMHKGFDLAFVGSFLSFLCLAVFANLLLSWALALLLSPVVVAAERLFLRGRDDRFGKWFWQRGYPLGILVVFSLPAIFQPVHYNLVEGWRPGLAAGVALAIGAAAWLGLLGTLRPPARAKRFVGICAILGITVTLLALSGGAAALVFGPTQPAARAGRPNILLVSIDSLRADHLHCYGYGRETSPTIDSLAAEGVLFKTVVSPTSWTLPAHLTLLTSLPPEEHGVVEGWMRWSGSRLSLAEVLWQEGYTTAGFVSGPYLIAEYGYSRGFDHYDDYSVKQLKPNYANPNHGTTSPDQLALVREWLTAWADDGRQRPFFLFLHMWDVHYDYAPPPPYDSLFDPEYAGKVTAENIEANPQIHQGMNPRDLEHVIALYDGEIRFTDFYLGQILNVLRTLGVYDDTIIVITSDHGDEFFEHGNIAHRRALYDETILVPLVIRYPQKVPRGRVVEQQVRLMDVAPTILGLAGVDQPTGFGTSAPKGPYAEQDLGSFILSDSPEASRGLVAFSNLVRRYPQAEEDPRQASIRTETFKLIQHRGASNWYELYDLSTDPSEQVNLVDAEPNVVVKLRQDLSSWWTVRRARQGDAQAIELSEEHKKQLRSLGYMD